VQDNVRNANCRALIGRAHCRGAQRSR
jgi:hypothetical protein